MSKPQPSDLTSAAELIAPPRARGLAVTRQSVTRQDVLDRSLAIADSEGLAGLTMRRLAKELQVSLVTLYQLVDGKEGILAALVDAVISDVAAESSTDACEGGAPAELVVRMWTATHERHIAHPAIAQLATMRPFGGRAVFRFWELALARLRACGLNREQAAHAYLILRDYFIGFTTVRLLQDNQPTDERSRLDRLGNLPRDEFPYLTASVPVFAEEMTTEHFTRNMTAILAGLLRQASEVGPPS